MTKKAAGRSQAANGHNGGSSAVAVAVAAEDVDVRDGLGINESSVRELSQVFKLLSDETRLSILMNLARSEELHVTDICLKLSQSQPAVSHHLALLRVSGLIESRREGKHNYYSLCVTEIGRLFSDLIRSSGPIPKKMEIANFLVNYRGS